MTTPAQAKHTIVVGVLGTGALAVIDQARQGNLPSGRIGVGVVLSGALLLGIAEFAPALAAGFAALMLVTAVFVSGGPAWDALARITKPTK